RIAPLNVFGEPAAPFTPAYGSNVSVHVQSGAGFTLHLLPIYTNIYYFPLESCHYTLVDSFSVNARIINSVRIISQVKECMTNRLSRHTMISLACNSTSVLNLVVNRNSCSISLCCTTVSTAALRMLT